MPGKKYWKKGQNPCDRFSIRRCRLKVVRAIEDNGGVVVCFENCSGMKPLDPIDEDNPDVYDALARKYLNIGCSCMSPNPRRMELLDRLIDDFHVDAWWIWFCRHATPTMWRLPWSASW